MADPHLLICGGCGFIGSAFVKLLRREWPETAITIFDLLTYAGSLGNLEEAASDSAVRFVMGDISVAESLKQVTDHRYALVVNFAAETHVDRSLYHTGIFARANVLGVVNLLAMCREIDSPYLQISTDEVYGPAEEDQRFAESDRLNPTSPYAASKAAADLMVISAIKTFSQSAAIIRTCNNFGPRQFPEKLIPFFIHNARENRALPLYGDGLQRRCWLHVDDFSEALLRVLKEFPAGEILNIGSDFEIENNAVAREIVASLSSRSEIKPVPDRPAHDRAYRIDSSRFESRYGPVRQRDFRASLRETINWYVEHEDVFSRLGQTETSDFLHTHYRDRS